MRSDSAANEPVATNPTHSFETLAACVNAARSGDTVKIAWSDPIEYTSVKISNKALIIRAAGGFWPHIVRRRSDPHLIDTNAPLVMQGIGLQVSRHGPALAADLDTGIPADGQLVQSIHAPLWIAHCRVVLDLPGRLHGPCIRIEDPLYCELRSSSIFTPNASEPHGYANPDPRLGQTTGHRDW